ncbi:MAG: hypothetical protein M1839_005929 [Geoglossum umbratile]|nr:MAG: hypothetical protein M1839_005929 [Geoglossum umbratile]
MEPTLSCEQKGIYSPRDEELMAPIASQYLSIYRDGQKREGELHISSSGWGQDQLWQLRVVPLLNLDPGQCFPPEYIGPGDSEELKKLLVDIAAPTSDDLKSWSQVKNKFKPNRLKYFHDNIADIIVTVHEFSLPFNNLGHKRQKSKDSDLSTSSNESPHQDSSQLTLTHLLTEVLESGNLEDVIKGWKLKVMPDSRTFKLPVLAGVPIMLFEAKPRHADGLKTPLGELEPYNPKTFAQEVAELLVQAYLNHKRYPKLDYQTTAMLTMHGTQMKLVVVDVSRTYIQSVTTSACPPPDEHLYVRQSRPYDMQNREQRIEGLKVVQGLLRFLKSGKMNVGIIQGRLENQK